MAAISTTTMAMASMVASNHDSITAVAELTSLVSENPHKFLRPSLEVQQAAIRAAKALLDPLAISVASSQAARRDANRQKRKRGEYENEEPVLQLRQVYIKGLEVKQIWEQAKRVLDAAQHEVEKDLDWYQDSHLAPNNSTTGSDLNKRNKTFRSEVEVESDEDEDEDEDEEEIEYGSDGAPQNSDSLDQQDIDTEEDIEADSDIVHSSDEESGSKRDTYITDPNGLNDGFFSIDDFNKQTQFLEQMDARGEEDNPSDEDEIDWDANPLAVSTKSESKTKNEAGEDDTASEGDGPVFDDGGSDSAEDGEMSDEDQDLDGEMPGLSNANEIRYRDFFEPPPKKPSKTKRMRALPKTQPPSKPKAAIEESSEDNEKWLQNDLERAMADVRRDLLDSDDEDFSEGNGSSDDGLGRRKANAGDKNMSTHEKQRAAIAAEIRRLEAANVAKRDWQLSGEARAVDRPVNSLIEEDLEFERTGKPIAPVTAETSEEIDALIKRRIIAREFDEVVRRVPGSLNLASETRRGRIELDDTKPQAGLGEVYEAEHQKQADPLSYIDKRSAAVKKQHAEIDILWKQVREQLDLLSNMHFKPKRVDIEIKTVEDRPRIAMEDARPVGEIESGEGGMLAPQEVYRPGTDARGGKDEVMLQGGAAVAKEEMSREEKLRRRRRNKERAKKATGNREVNVVGQSTGKKSRKKAKEEEKANIIEDLKRGGVKVVGKGGELQSIGRQKKGRTEGAEAIGSNLKL